MAPGGGKRKRNERGSVDSGENRPSPHRPGNTNLGGGGFDREDGRRRSSRGGRYTGRGPRNDSRRNSSGNLNTLPGLLRSTTGQMDPPPLARRPSNSTQGQIPVSTPSPNVVAQSPPPEPKQNILPYDYAYVTDERVASWSTTGRQEIAAAGAQAMHDIDTLELSSIFQELIRAAMDMRVDTFDAGSCIKDIIGPDTAPYDDTDDRIDGSALFLDSLSIMTDVENFDHGLQQLAIASGVSPILMRQMLDAPLLQALGLARTTFIKSGIRQVTNLLYRQANHNLLREETEGYSKLVTELFTTSGGEPPSSDVVEDTFERVKGLIGTFDLDVGRVLDVTLDVFAAVLIKQFRFFIKFLRVSSWWPRESSLRGLVSNDDGGLPKWALPGSSGWVTTEEDEELLLPQREKRDRLFWDRARQIGIAAFFELGGRQVMDAKMIEQLQATDEDADAESQWIKTTGTVPPPGNRVAAQLLGFKLRFYASAAREKDDTLPSNLIYLTALLIKIGFISLRDLYPHLWPLDEGMTAVKEARLKELAEKERLNRPGGGVKNALMTAGALADDTLPLAPRPRDTGIAKPDGAVAAPAETEVEDQDALPEPGDQKVQLLINLLTIGAIPESLFILGRFPWLPEAYPEIYDLLHRILHHSIKKVYESSLASKPAETQFPGKKWPDADQSSAPKGFVRRNDASPRKPLRWPFPEKSDVNDGITYRFYWDEWADNIPVCQSVDDIFTLCDTLLNYSNVNIGRDASLLSKLASIGSEDLSRDHSDTNLLRWEGLLKRLLVPALSLTKANTSVVNEIYDMLRYYSGHRRYVIYAEWFEGQTSRLPAMVSAFSRARLETLSTMKRISMTNLTAMARTLAKTAYASPGIVFKVALDQIEAYSNLTEVVVECAKYFTDLGYDVLVWSLMSSLGGKSRSRTRDDAALLTSRWLIALSKFSGKVFRRYSIMNPAPILQYVNDQLCRGNSTDLIILEEFIAQMSGVVSDVDFTDSQLLAMTGGEVLRRQTLINLQDKRFESAKTAKRLMRSLTETRLAGQLLVAIAQHRQSAIYEVPEEDAHIKYLATMVDETQRILVQYLDLLRSNLTVEQFNAQVPETPELMTEFGLDPPLAFLIGRAGFSRRIAALSTRAENGTPIANGSLHVDGDGDIGMAKEVDETTPALDVENAVIAEITEESNGVGLVIDESPPPIADTWQDAIAPLVAAVQEVLPRNNWQVLNPEFFVMFWQLSLPDINLPMDSYTAENARLTRELSELMKDRSDMSRTGLARRDEARKVIELTRDELLKESKQEMIKYERTRTRLNREKLHWFINISGRYDNLNDSLLEECFLPRLLLSPSDADYCFKMIKFLHNNATPNFRTLGLYGRLLRSNRLRSIIFACTIREAECLGRFLKLVLGDLSRWHTSKATFEKEALGANKDMPGFAKKLGKDLKPESLVEYDEFRRILFGWHKQLNSALRICLSGTEWMHIRNAITILKAVVEHFPAVDFMGKAFEASLTAIAAREKDKREDLSLLANASMPELKKREKKWVIMQAFATNLGEPANQLSSGAGKSGQSTTPQPEKTSSKIALNATAPEFKPQSRLSSNGGSTPKQQGNEVEDGEVDDTRTTAASTNGSIEKSVLPEVTTTASASPMPPAASTTLPETISNPLVLETPAEGTSRAGTPKPVLSALPSGPSSRTEATRNQPINSVVERPSGLPTRPDIPIPGHRQLPGRPSDRRDTHRAGDAPRDRVRDSSYPDRRTGEPGHRDSARPIDRNVSSERDRERDRVRDLDRHESLRRGELPRDAREHDRFANESARLPEYPGRGSRSDMGPPRSVGPPADRNSIINPERLPLVNSERQDLIIQERGVHGASTREPPRSEPSRAMREDHREKPNSRPQSPRGDRYGVDRDLSDGRRLDRSAIGRNPSQHLPDLPRVRHDENQAPLGPRGERGSDRMINDRPRDSSAFEPTPQQTRIIDPDHGRLNQPSDPGFGRLNPMPSQEIPSGPRSHTSRSSSHQSSAVQPRADTRTQEIARPPTPDRQPPTGPASSRQRRGAASQHESQSSTPLTTPTMPPAQSPTAGVHPDRLKQLDTPIPPLPPPPTSVSNFPSGLHPSRLPAFQNDQQPGRQQQMISQSSGFQARVAPPPQPPAISVGPPSGPKSLQSSTPPSTSNGMTTPTGPSTGDHARAPRRQLQGINSTLQQAGQQNGPDRSSDRNSIRGRSNRMNNSGGITEPSNLPPPTQVTPQRLDSRDRNADRGTGELFPNRMINGPDIERPDSRGERESRREPSGRRGQESGQHTHPHSRSRSPERDRTERRMRDRPPEGERGAGGRGEFRDSRGGGNGSIGSVRDGNRDGSRRQGAGNGDLRDQDPSRRLGWESERVGRQDGRPEPAPRAEEPAWGGIHPTDRGRRSEVRGDDRRDSRGPSMQDAGGSKRRSDEGVGIGREKRARQH